MFFIQTRKTRIKQILRSDKNLISSLTSFSSPILIIDRVFRVQIVVKLEKFDSQIVRVLSNISNFSSCDIKLADA